MEPNFIKKRIYELTQKEHLDSASNEQLLHQYHLDKQNNIPLEQSEARELLIMGNEKLVFRILHERFGIYELSKDIEEYSLGMMGLIKAVDTFDISRNVAFSTYATQVVINQIRMEYRKRNKISSLSNVLSINEPVGNSFDGDVFYLEDYIGEDDDTVECIIHEQNIQTLKKNLQYLKEEERIAIIYGYGLFGNEKLKQSEIGKMLGVNQGYVSRMMKYGYEKLKLLETPNSQLSKSDLSAKLKLLNHSDSGSDSDLKLVETY